MEPQNPSEAMIFMFIPAADDQGQGYLEDLLKPEKLNEFDKYTLGKIDT